MSKWTVTLETEEEFKKVLKALTVDGSSEDDEEPEEKPAPKKRGRKPKATKEEPEEKLEEKPKTKRGRKPKKTSSDEVTLKDVRKAANTLAKRVGVQDVKDMLEEKFDVTTLNDLEEDQYADCLAAIAAFDDSGSEEDDEEEI